MGNEALLAVTTYVYDIGCNSSRMYLHLVSATSDNSVQSLQLMQETGRPATVVQHSASENGFQSIHASHRHHYTDDLRDLPNK